MLPQEAFSAVRKSFDARKVGNVWHFSFLFFLTSFDLLVKIFFLKKKNLDKSVMNYY